MTMYPQTKVDLMMERALMTIVIWAMDLWVLGAVETTMTGIWTMKVQSVP